MPTAGAISIPPDDASPRRSLQWGGGVLILGLGLVGIGQADEGAVFVLLGLLLTIYGIHTYGRLGPEDAERSLAMARYEAKRAESNAKIWRGSLTVVAGLVLLVGGLLGEAPVDPTRRPVGLLTLVVGFIYTGFAWGGLKALGKPPEEAPANEPGGSPEGASTQAKPGRVARRRRLDKHPAP